MAITQKIIVNATQSYPDMMDWSDLNGNTHRYKHIAMMTKIKLIYFNSSASKKKRAISRSKNKNCPKTLGLRF